MGDEPSTQQVAASPRFGILGPLQVTDAGHRPLPLGGPRARELLALLLLNPNRPLSSEYLVTAMWGESPSDGAATTLRSHVGAVRRVLAAAGAGDALGTRAGGYLLALAPADLDAEVFAGLYERPQEALGIGDPAHAAALLGEALALWRGDVLSDLGPPDFADAVVARRGASLGRGGDRRGRRARPRPASGGGGAAAGAGRGPPLPRAAVRAADAGAVPLGPAGRRAVGVCGDQAAPRRGAGPRSGPDLQELQTAVLRQDPQLLLSVDATAPVTEVGPSPSTPRETLARQPPDAVFAALRRSAMVGRDAGLETTRAAWQDARDGGRGLLAVGGPAGVGKSRLAAEGADLATQDGAIVLVGRCDPAVPYAGLASAFAGSAAARQLAAAVPPGARARLHPLLPLEPDAEILPQGAGHPLIARPSCARSSGCSSPLPRRRPCS